MSYFKNIIYKRILITLAILIFSAQLVQSQFIIKNADDRNWYLNLPQEKVYLHFNNKVFFAGEQLLYQIYCLNVKTNTFSENSKMAYVELVGVDGNILRHKIRLEKGVGASEFMIPTTLQTGNYKLIAYTKWMKNVNDNNFFQADISIINPYAKVNFDDSGLNELSREDATQKFEILKLETNKEIYNTREEVIINITSLKTTMAYGIYSISVSKINEAQNFGNRETTKTFALNTNQIAKNRTRSVGEAFILPEFKGEMITGKIYDASGKPANNVEVALSILSDEAFQDIVLTNELGVFYFQLQHPYSTPRAMVQVVGDDRESYRVEVDEHSGMDYSKLEFDDLKIHSKYKDAIVQRSVYNQIQSAYSDRWQHELVLPDYEKPFYGNNQQTFVLDDYKRFSTVAETLIEVVENAWHERKAGGKRYINVREREQDPYYGEDVLPMLVVDGALVQDHDLVMNFDANKVESISVLRDEYYYGDRVYQGVLYVKTFDNDFQTEQNGEFLKMVELFAPQYDVNYYEHRYTNEADLDRIPDYRNQLLWTPKFQFQTYQEELKFYTSDSKGVFRISLEGFTNNGMPITITKFIRVQ